MAGGGLMQLIVYGSQDIYLTGNPQITFYKAVYRRHTNFAVESIQQSVQGSIKFGNNVSVSIKRNGDLLKKLWVQYSPQNLLSGINEVRWSGDVVGANVGHSLLDTIDLLIGGQLIDRHYGKWLTIWNYLTDKNDNGLQGPIDEHGTGPGEGSVIGDSATNNYISRPTQYNRMAYTHRANPDVISSTGAPMYAYIPLQFWFCRHPGLAIPLIALQYHEVILNIKLGSYSGITNCPTQTGRELIDFAVYADYVYLDTTERRQFAQNSHEYLIDQVQLNSNMSTSVINLNFSHPVKELIWAIPPTSAVDVNYTLNVSGPAGSSSPPSSFFKTTPNYPNNYKLILNGSDRFAERDITYFTRTQVWESHSGFGSVLFPDSIGVYSFALKPEEHQPSGTCNFSRLDKAQLARTNTAPLDPLDVYAINYNVLRIVSGMGGLAFSN